MADAYEPGRNYCVISGRCSTNWDRTWKPTKSEAIEHARYLIQKDKQRSDELLVVKVVSRVRLASPPIEVVDVD